MYKRLPERPPLPAWPARFGMRSKEQVLRDFSTVLRHLPRRDRFVFDLGSAGLLRPDLSLPAYAGLVPEDQVAPIFNFFDRSGGGRFFRAAVTRRKARDFRGGRLSYDEHDGTDFVCPPGTPLVAAAPGVVVATRDNWLRGGLTACVDHGNGVVTQYTHLTSLLVPVGEKVGRGQPLALSGVSGFDLTQFFPFVPPHVHFMVWIHGRPVDPYRASGEEALPGAWAHGNNPQTSAGALPGDARPPDIADIPVDTDAMRRLIPLCQSARIRDELAAAPSDVARIAILEDSLHHDRFDWPEEAQQIRLRPQGDPGLMKLTLPLPAKFYSRARAADAWFTRPSEAT